MSLSKIVEPVTILPHKSTEFSRKFSTPSLNVAAAKIFELNQICNAFNSLRLIHFPNIADGEIGNLLGVNAFAFTYPTHVTPGKKIIRLVYKLDLVGPSTVNMSIVYQPSISSPQVSRRRDLFPICKETEQKNLNCCKRKTKKKNSFDRPRENLCQTGGNARSSNGQNLVPVTPSCGKSQ